MTVLRPEDIISILGVKEKDIDCSGLKMTVGEVYRFTSRGRILINSKELPEYKEVKPAPINNRYYLELGVYLVRYREYVKIPEDCIGLVLPRSSLLRMGATLHTAIWDPGYEGRGIGLLVVYNIHGIELERGAQIGQMILVKMTGSTRFLYRGIYYKEGRISNQSHY